MRLDFSTIKFNQFTPPAKTGKQNGVWLSPEQIEIKPEYTANDITNLSHVDYTAGVPPYLRGPYATMYTIKPWTIRQ